MADPNLLNHAVWYATKGFSIPYPGERRDFYPNQLNSRVIDSTDK
jgi:hypothetical protein